MNLNLSLALCSALMDEAKHEGASSSLKDGVTTSFSESECSHELVFCLGEGKTVSKSEKMHSPYFELMVQRGNGWGEEERSTGKSNRVRLR